MSHIFARVTAFQVHKSSCILTSDPTRPNLHRLLKEKHGVMRCLSVQAVYNKPILYSDQFSHALPLTKVSNRRVKSWRNRQRMHTIVCEPGQFCFLHFSCPTFSVLLHGLPPFLGFGESHFRSRDRIFARVTAFQVHKSSCILTSDPTRPSLHRSLKEKHREPLFIFRLNDIF